MRDPEKLCVKELADALEVSTRYVYQMRACGFVMEGFRPHGQTTTVKTAVEWIEKNDFRVVRGVGRVFKDSEGRKSLDTKPNVGLAIGLA
jgi:hypothetical protein